MVMGVEKSKTIINEMEDVEALFVYSNEDGTVSTYVSEGIKPNVTLIAK